MPEQKTIKSNRILISITVFFVLLQLTFVKAQDIDSLPTKTKAFELYFGAGRMFYLSTPNIPYGFDASVVKSNIGGTFRLMWHTYHLISFGIESGYTPFYSYTFNDTNYSGKYSLNAIPILIEISAPLVKRVNFFLGGGNIILLTEEKYATTEKSSANSLGFIVAANYVLPLSGTLALAGEVKWLNTIETHDNLLSLQVQVLWKFYKYY